MTKEASRGDQADLPAEQARAQAPARLPRADGDGGRAQGAGAPPGQGPQAPLGLSPALKLVRLTRRAQFLYVQKGLKAARPSVLIEARRTEPVRAETGLGFTASRKVGNAVIRNRARRRLREAARALLPLHGLAGVDYVFVARASSAEAPWAGLLDDVRSALIRLAADLSGPRSTRGPAPGAQKPRKSRPKTTPTESDER